MEIRIELPKYKEDYIANMIRLNLLSNELLIARNSIITRLNEIENNSIEKAIPSLKNNSRTFFMTHKILGMEDTDPILNLGFKTFLTVFRQFTEKFFRILYQLKEPLGYANGKTSFPDLSRNKAFSSHFEKVLKKEYDFDPLFLNVIDEYRDFFIISRIARNAIKSQAICVTSIFNNKATFIVPLNPQERNDPTFVLLRQKLSVKIVDLKHLSFREEYLDQCGNLSARLVSILKEKIESLA